MPLKYVCKVKNKQTVFIAKSFNLFYVLTSHVILQQKGIRFVKKVCSSSL